MAYNGSGVWVRLYNWTNDAANGIKIRADRMDAEFNDMCNNGLSAVLTRDGQGAASANLPMNGFVHTGAGNGAAAGQYLTYGQPQAAICGTVAAAFGTVGVGLIGNAFTQTDSTTAVGTVATAYASTFGAATFATAVNAVTITNAYGLYLKDPVAGAHTTLTNKFALGVDSLKVAGAINIAGATSAAAIAATSLSTTGGITSGTGVTISSGNLSMTLGNLSGLGYTVAADGGSGSILTMTGFGNTATYNWAGITGSANFQIVAGGSGGVILNNGATSWSAVSDYRAKTLKGLYSSSGEIIDGVPVYLAALNENPTVDKAMFVAHELQAALPYAVHGEKDGENMQRIESTDPLVPILWAEVRSLRARLAAIDGKV